MTEPAGMMTVEARQRIVAEAVAQAYERAAQAAESLQDAMEEERADRVAREREGMDDEIDRLRHHKTVMLYNSGIRKCAAAIRALKEAS